MQEKSLHSTSLYSSQSLSSSADELTETFVPDPRFERGLEGRRRKAAATLMGVWTGTVTLHLLPVGSWIVFGLTAVVGIHLLVIFFKRPNASGEAIDSERAIDSDADLPFMSLLVAAKNEEAVIESLVHDLCNLSYPSDRYELWIVDDASSDQTPQILDQLTLKYPHLNVFHRPENAGGGKSGALNDVLPKTQGDILGVFDADAQVGQDVLKSIVPLFQHPKVGAIQLRKATMNWQENFWTYNQASEMLFDSFMQARRIANGGIGELRGNGQFVRRSALQQCDGWNEQTITDDLDLTLRLHLNDWDIHFLSDPAVGEEGVTSGLALWHQRSRWAEGGYQRYLDYWRLIIRNKLGYRKSFDLLTFLFLQYIVPTAALPDALMAIARHRLPILSPLTGLVVCFSFLFMSIGIGEAQFAELRAKKLKAKKVQAKKVQTKKVQAKTLQAQKSQAQRRSLPDADMSTPSLSILEIVGTSLRTLGSSVMGTLYMVHWIPVVAATTFRISVRPKRLKWVKTAHRGTST
ncbi:MAG: glycosyltransferase family 2 protein [Leptolyngbyaceae bacterium]|nr:glycosyltransferase family 2 protein [Leptolyngbyaceae bacterium]